MLVQGERAFDLLCSGRWLPYYTQSDVVLWGPRGEALRRSSGTWEQVKKLDDDGELRPSMLSPRGLTYHFLRRSWTSHSHAPWSRLVFLDLDVRLSMSAWLNRLEQSYARAVVDHRMRKCVQWVRSLGGEPVVLTSPSSAPVHGWSVMFMVSRQVQRQVLAELVRTSLMAFLREEGDPWGERGGAGIDIMPGTGISSWSRVPLGKWQWWVCPDTMQRIDPALGHRPEHVSAFLDALESDPVPVENLRDVDGMGVREKRCGSSATHIREIRVSEARPLARSGPRPGPGGARAEEVSTGPRPAGPYASTEIFDACIRGASQALHGPGGTRDAALSAVDQVLDQAVMSPADRRGIRKRLCSPGYVGGWQRGGARLTRDDAQREGEDEIDALERAMVITGGQMTTKDFAILYPGRRACQEHKRGTHYRGVLDKALGMGCIRQEKRHSSGRHPALYVWVGRETMACRRARAWHGVNRSENRVTQLRAEASSVPCACAWCAKTVGAGGVDIVEWLEMVPRAGPGHPGRRRSWAERAIWARVRDGSVARPQA
jgi:hypothetical protein